MVKTNRNWPLLNKPFFDLSPINIFDSIDGWITIGSE